jgi:hypothetical protein
MGGACSVHRGMRYAYTIGSENTKGRYLLEDRRICKNYIKMDLKEIRWNLSGLYLSGSG